MDELFTRYRLGPVELANRMVMAPMTRARAQDDGTPTGMMMEYYVLRSSAGLIITEATNISPQAKGWEKSPGIFTDEHVTEWKKITDGVHQQGGHIYLQLWHTGRASHSYFQPNGQKPVSSSPVAKDSDDPVRTDEGHKDPEVPHELSKAEIADIVRDYGSAAKRARQAGFDGVEVHAANGYLLDQFLRDGVNQRTDEYGGSTENKFRFLSEVLTEVKKSWLPGEIGVRLSPTNPFNSMSDSDPETHFTEYAKLLNAFDLSYLHLLEARPGIDHMMAQDDVPYVAPKIREVYEGTLMLNAGYDCDSGNEAIESNKADLIAYGIPYIANPDLVERYIKRAPLNEPDQDTFYTHGENGYLTYPLLAVEAVAS